MPATRDDVLRFVRGHSLAVQASVSPSHVPQAAVVGFVVTDGFELFFDTVESTRKAHNLRQNPAVAVVIGTPNSNDAGSEITVQYEGVADEPEGAELDALKALYFARFPDGRDRQQWPGILYFRIRPRWLRFSNYGTNPPDIVEFAFDGR